MGSASLAEIHELTEPKLNSPQNPLELMGFTGGYSTIFDSLIGVEHPASLSLRAHAFFWIYHAGELASLVPVSDLPGLLLLFIHSIHVTTMVYLNEAMRIGIAAPSPDYKYIEDAFHRRTSSGLSQMPRHYLDAKKATLAPKATPVTSAPAPKLDTTTSTKLSSCADAPLAHQNGDWLAKFAASPKLVSALKELAGRPPLCLTSVSYTHLTLPTNREV